VTDPIDDFLARWHRFLAQRDAEILAKRRESPA
jgi:hypothetical protein